MLMGKEYLLEQCNRCTSVFCGMLRFSGGVEHSILVFDKDDGI